MQHNSSKELFNKAKQLIPGGVNSPVRAFGSVGLTPPFIILIDGGLGIGATFTVRDNRFVHPFEAVTITE